MSKETDKYLQGSTGRILKTVFISDRKVIGRYSIVALFCLVISIILISFDLRLPAGCFIIIATSTGVIVVRKAFSLLSKVGELLEEASKSSDKKDDVITDFSHRIREPLNNLVIIGDLLIGSGLQKKQKELLETFIASTNNMVNTVNELTMQTAGNINYEDRKKIKFNLISTIQNTIDLFSLKDSARIDFILSRKDMNLFEVVGDPIILKQIFLDLFNTVESQDSGNMTKVSIGLKKLRESNNESFINFRIQTDRDIILIDEKGIPGNLAAKLISSSKGYFHQEFGNGFTVLDFTIPFLNLTPEVKKQMASPILEELKLKERTKKELKDVNILLVEDNSINQKITLLTLRPLVNNIETAINGKEALDKFGTSTYDLILMDIQMPVMSGLVAAEKIRALESSTNAHVPIIAITANAMLGDKERCLSAGMDDYISKPFQPAALIEKIKRFV
jgi:CheY-like chemotaxis protein/preprotein translocase subunit SecE